MPANAFEFFMGRQNARVVMLLEKNHDLSGAVQGLLERVVDFCNAKGLDASKVIVRDAHITEDGYVQFRLGSNP